MKIFDIWDNDLGQRTNGNRPPLGEKFLVSKVNWLTNVYYRLRKKYIRLKDLNGSINKLIILVTSSRLVNADKTQDVYSWMVQLLVEISGPEDNAKRRRRRGHLYKPFMEWRCSGAIIFEYIVWLYYTLCLFYFYGIVTDFID